MLCRALPALQDVKEKSVVQCQAQDQWNQAFGAGSPQELTSMHSSAAIYSDAADLCRAETQHCV